MMVAGWTAVAFTLVMPLHSTVAQPPAPGPAAGSPEYETRRALTPAERDLVWNQLIPALAGANTASRDNAKNRLRTIGLPVVKELVKALRTDLLLIELNNHDQLARLKPEIETDLTEWYTRNAPALVNRAQISRLLTGFRRFQTSTEVTNGVKAFYDALASGGEKVPAPGVLNSLRAYAAKTIGEIGDTSAWGPVRNQLADQSQEVIANAIEALGDLGAPLEAALATEGPSIFNFCYHENLIVRSRAWTALRKLDARDAVDRLIADLGASAGDLQRRDRIVECLQGITMQGYGPNPAAWQNWWSRVKNTENPLGLENPR